MSALYEEFLAKSDVFDINKEPPTRDDLVLLARQEMSVDVGRWVTAQRLVFAIGLALGFVAIGLHSMGPILAFSVEVLTSFVLMVSCWSFLMKIKGNTRKLSVNNEQFSPLDSTEMANVRSLRQSAEISPREIDPLVISYLGKVDGQRRELVRGEYVQLSQKQAVFSGFLAGARARRALMEISRETRS